jgi:hypothetical protein
VNAYFVHACTIVSPKCFCFRSALHSKSQILESMMRVTFNLAPLPSCVALTETDARARLGYELCSHSSKNTLLCPAPERPEYSREAKRRTAGRRDFLSCFSPDYCCPLYFFAFIIFFFHSPLHSFSCIIFANFVFSFMVFVCKPFPLESFLLFLLSNFILSLRMDSHASILISQNHLNNVCSLHPGLDGVCPVS